MKITATAGDASTSGRANHAFRAELDALTRELYTLAERLKAPSPNLSAVERSVEAIKSTTWVPDAVVGLLTVLIPLLS